MDSTNPRRGAEFFMKSSGWLKPELLPVGI